MIFYVLGMREVLRCEMKFCFCFVSGFLFFGGYIEAILTYPASFGLP